MFEKITPDAEGHARLELFLATKAFLPYFFFSPYTLITFLTQREKELYVATLGEETQLVLHRLKGNNVRFLFWEPSAKMQEAALDHFKPNFIAVNDSVNPPSKGEAAISGTEAMLEVGHVSSLIDPKIRRQYEKCVERHPNLVYKAYEAKDEALMREFLESWDHTRSEELNALSKTFNDRNFLDHYASDPKLVGGIIFDGSKPVAIALSVPASNGQMIGVLNKCLRGYTQLGVYTYVERARQLLALGYKELYVSSINNAVKERIVLEKDILKNYNFITYKKPDFEVTERMLLYFPF